MTNTHPSAALAWPALVITAVGCLNPTVSTPTDDGTGGAGGSTDPKQSTQRTEIRVTNDTGRLLYRYAPRCTLGEGWIEIVDRGFPASAMTTPRCGSNEFADCFSPPFDVRPWEPGETVSYTWEGGGWFDTGECWEYRSAPVGEQIARICAGESYSVQNYEPPMDYIAPADCAGEPGWCYLHQQHCLDIPFTLGSGDQLVTVEASLPQAWLP